MSLLSFEKDLAPSGGELFGSTIVNVGRCHKADSRVPVVKIVRRVSCTPCNIAFMDELGPQCGFCTPGQVMAAVALLKTNPNPTRGEAREAMAGNLCRCGAYDHYLNGVMRAAREV